MIFSLLFLSFLQSNIIENTQLSENQKTVANVNTEQGFLDELNNPKTDIIKLTDHVTLLSRGSGDDPLIIRRPVIIDGSSFTLTLRLAGIILGGDATIMNIGIEFTNAVRNAIIANGYSLTLDRVKCASKTWKIIVFAGGVENTLIKNIPNQGNNAIVTIKGGCEIETLLAGSLSDVGTNVADPPFKFEHPVTLNIEEDAENIPYIYSSGAREKRGEKDGNGLVPDQKYEVTKMVTIKLNNNVMKNIDGTTGQNTPGTEIIYENHKQNYPYSPKLVFMSKIVVKKGALAPAKGSTFKGSITDIVVQKGASLDISKYNTEPYLNIRNLDGGGCLVLCQTDIILVILGKVTGVTDIAIGNENFPEPPNNVQVYIMCQQDLDAKAFRLKLRVGFENERLVKETLSQGCQFTIPAAGEEVKPAPVIKAASIASGKYSFKGPQDEIIVPIDVQYEGAEDLGLGMIADIEFSYKGQKSQPESDNFGTYRHILTIEGNDYYFEFKNSYTEEKKYFLSVLMEKADKAPIVLETGDYEISIAIPQTATHSQTEILLKYTISIEKETIPPPPGPQEDPESTTESDEEESTTESDEEESTTEDESSNEEKLPEESSNKSPEEETKNNGEDAQSNEDATSNMEPGAIAGIVIGVIAGIAIIIGVIIFIIKKPKARSAQVTQNLDLDNP